MGRKDISFYILKQVVADLGQEFFTKDVSEDQRLRKAHFDLIDHSQFHAFVGGALSDYDVSLEIKRIGYHSKRGSIWRKTGLSTQATGCIIHRSSPSTSISIPLQKEEERLTNQFGLGPQYAQDNILARRMRKHQSWYRSEVLNLPYGTGPGPNDTSAYGNMLTRSDGEAGRNFLSPEIFEVVQNRISQGGGAVEKYRLLHNMLSSQPMCFNLFGPLVRDQELARTLLEELVPEKISEVIRVSIEWSPKPASDYLNDNTAFDAFIEYRTTDGRLFGLGIETKLSEPFSQKEYDKPEYRRWMHGSDVPWLPESWSKVQTIEHNQLWREHLMAVSMRNRSGSVYDHVRLMLVHHPADIECARYFSNYKKLLKDDDDSLISFSLDQIVDSWLSVVNSGDQLVWLKLFNNRYVDLE